MFVCLCHRSLPQMSGVMMSLLFILHRRCGNVFLPSGDDFVQQWARQMVQLTRVFRNSEALVLQNCLPNIFHKFWHHQGRSATMVFIVNIAQWSEMLQNLIFQFIFCQFPAIQTHSVFFTGCLQSLWLPGVTTTVIYFCLGMSNCRNSNFTAVCWAT